MHAIANCGTSSLIAAAPQFCLMRRCSRAGYPPSRSHDLTSLHQRVLHGRLRHAHPSTDLTDRQAVVIQRPRPLHLLATHALVSLLRAGLVEQSQHCRPTQAIALLQYFDWIASKVVSSQLLQRLGRQSLADSPWYNVTYVRI
jgi:hypothetical protein